MSQDPVEKFFEDSDLTLDEATALVQDGLKGADFGEFFHEMTEQEALLKDKGRYTRISIGNRTAGFGVRFGQDKHVGYSYANTFNKAALQEAIKDARQIKQDGERVTTDLGSFGRTPAQMYATDDPMAGIGLEEKIRLIDALESYALSLDPDITNVAISYKSTRQDVHIITPDGQSLVDTRPLTSLFVKVSVKDEEGNIETGRSALGGRVSCEDVFAEGYKKIADKALHIAKELLIAEDAPSGTMDVVMAKGWPSVILHEAVGHGLEGDFNRQGISVYSGKIGEQVAHPSVTVFEQGDMQGMRGSLHFDDEGTPPQKNILIENGVLKGYMQDRQNAGLMDTPLTGNGRRQSYKHLPMVRMTNTCIANGEYTPEEIISSVKDGLYVQEMDGGQVDITSGAFNMNVTLCYRIRDGELCEPIKGASIIGDGLQVIQSIEKVGNDMDIENAYGRCGKSGQSVPVGSGQPTILVKNLTIGGMK